MEGVAKHIGMFMFLAVMLIAEARREDSTFVDLVARRNKLRITSKKKKMRELRTSRIILASDGTILAGIAWCGGGLLISHEPVFLFFVVGPALICAAAAGYLRWKAYRRLLGI